MADEQPNTNSDSSSGSAEGENSESKTESYELTVGGQTIKVENLDDLKSMAQQGHDYTQKSQALADERKTFDQKVNDKALELYREAIANGEVARTGEGEGGGGSNDDDLTGEEKLAKRVDELESKLKNHQQSVSNRDQDSALQAVIADVSKKHESLSEDDIESILHKVHKTADESSDVASRLDKAATELIASRKTHDQKVIDDFIEKRKVDPLSIGETTPGTGVLNVNKDKKVPKDFEEARAMAEEAVKAMPLQ